MLAAFRVLDGDGSNHISVVELADAIAILGAVGLSISVLEDILRQVDMDRSCAIDCEEFKTLMLDQLGTDRARLELAFSVFDQDGSCVGRAATVSASPLARRASTKARQSIRYS